MAPSLALTIANCRLESWDLYSQIDRVDSCTIAPSGCSYQHAGVAMLQMGQLGLLASIAEVRTVSLSLASVAMIL